MIAPLVLMFCVGPATPEDLPAGVFARLGTMRWRFGHADGIRELGFSPDGSAVFTAGGGFRAFAIGDGSPLPGPPDDSLVRCFHFLPGGKEVLLARVDQAGSSPTSVTVERRSWPDWRKRGEEAFTLTRLDYGYSSFSFSPDGKRLKIQPLADRPALATLGSAKPPYVFPKMFYWAAEAAFSPDGKEVFVAAQDGEVAVHDPADARVLRVLRPPAARSYIRVRAVVPAGVVVQDAVGLALLDSLTGRVLHRAAAPTGGVSPLGPLLAVCDRTHVRFLDARTFEARRRLALPATVRAGGLVFSENGKSMLVINEEGISLIDVGTGRHLNPTPGHRGAITALRFSPDGKRLASGGWDGDAIIWDVPTARALHRLAGHENGVAGLAWSPDGRTLAVGSGGTGGNYDFEAFVHLWDTAKGEGRSKFSAHLRHVDSLEFLDGGRTLVTAGTYSSRIRWWDVGKGHRLGQAPDVPSPKLLPGTGTTALFTERGGGLWRLRPEEPRPVNVLLARIKLDAAIVVGGQALVLGDGGLQRIELPSGKVIESVPKFDTSGLRPACFSADGKRLACQGGSSVVIIEVASGRVLGTATGHVGYLRATALSPDGRWLATGAGGTILIWDVARLKGPKK